jgi:hypothetical protein
LSRRGPLARAARNTLVAMTSNIEEDGVNAAMEGGHRLQERSWDFRDAEARRDTGRTVWRASHGLYARAFRKEGFVVVELIEGTIIRTRTTVAIKTEDDETILGADGEDLLLSLGILMLGGAGVPDQEHVGRCEDMACAYANVYRRQWDSGIGMLCATPYDGSHVSYTDLPACRLTTELPKRLAGMAASMPLAMKGLAKRRGRGTAAMLGAFSAKGTAQSSVQAVRTLERLEGACAPPTDLVEAMIHPAQALRS